MDSTSEDPDFDLVQEQASMMVTRVAGLLNHLSPEQKEIVVKQIMNKLAGMTNV